MTDYKAQVLGGMKGFIPFSECMKSVILDMVENGVSPAEAEKAICDIAWEVTGDGGLEWINYFLELRLRAGGASPAPTPGAEIESLISPETIHERVKRG